MKKNLRVILLHGTWGAGAEWKNPGSDFQRRFQSHFKNDYESIRFVSFAWNAKNRWRSREYVEEQLDKHLAEHAQDDAANWEYLVVAHSHGGNIATQAVRERLRKDPDIPIRGVVCLNTPFLKHELRASSGYLKAWLFIALGLLAALISLAPSLAEENLPKIFQTLTEAGISITTRKLMITLVGISIALLILVLLSNRLRKDEEKNSLQCWGPRPEVLCLSCPDDEAITALGLGEGIANLPQLLLHPLGVVAFFGIALTHLYVNGDLQWCGADTQCWSMAVHTLSVSFSSWLILALAGGLLGSVIISLLFGLSLRQTAENFASRILVSYSPLRPANSHFRGISDIPLKWVNPLQFFHSQIYRSPKTVEEMYNWLHRHAEKFPSAVTQKTADNCETTQEQLDN